MYLSGLFLTAVVAAANALYTSNSDVVNLTPSNFDKIMDSDEIWMVEFYAPWCGHCRQLAPEWEKAAKALKGIVKVAGVDADAHGSLAQKYNVRGFPTIKIFGLNKKSPTDYQGARNAEGVVNSALSECRSVAQARLSGKSGSSGGGRRSSGGSGGSGSKEDVVELTEANFQQLVINSEDLWLVEFFAPWCGHCKNLEPEWRRAASELKGKVKLGMVDATVHQQLAAQFQVQGYPTIKWFAGGSKSGPQDAKDYEGGRTASDIVAFALDKVTENVAPPEIKQLLNDESVKEACEEHPLCIFSFLPHILDSQASGRNDYINILNKLGEKYKKKMWGWLWSEAAAQMNIEQALEVGGFGYPAMVAVNIRKGKYVVMRGAFHQEGIDEFLRAIAVGRGRTAPLRDSKIPAAVTTEPWDGKDGKPPVEEDIDVSDVDMDDDKKKKTEL